MPSKKKKSQTKTKKNPKQQNSKLRWFCLCPSRTIILERQRLTSIVGAVQHYMEKEDNTVACSRKREKVL